jgi:hypothetical protein
MKSLKDLLQIKANDIDESGVKTDLELIQKELDRLYEGAVTITRLQDSVGMVQTPNASLASNLRMEQVQLVEDLNSSLKNKLDRLIIRIQ